MGFTTVKVTKTMEALQNNKHDYANFESFIKAFNFIECLDDLITELNKTFQDAPHKHKV